jgi:hypothetical protein
MTDEKVLCIEKARRYLIPHPRPHSFVRGDGCHAAHRQEYWIWYGKMAFATF